MWQFWIDVGGTFTDCIAVSDNGRVRQFKTLSSGTVKGTVAGSAATLNITDSLRHRDPPDFWNGSQCSLYDDGGHLLLAARVTAFDAASGRLTLDQPIPSAAVVYELDPNLPAPILAIRWLLNLSPGQRCPAVNVRFGTTRGTNALLTRSGAKTALLITRGFADLPSIGDQQRPELFTLDIRRPVPLYSMVFEIDERIDSTGQVLKPLDAAEQIQQLRQKGLDPDEFDSVAICLMHAYGHPEHELRLEAALRGMGFQEVSRSSEVSPQIGIVPRCETTVLDAYLNPILRRYLDRLQDELPGSRIQVMTSVGGLVDCSAFRGRDCVLSGPAGGIVGFSRVAAAEGESRAIGFDMGGTSTDVARFDGTFELENETVRAGVRIMTPVLAIETVAAGGGSICGFDGVRLHVGPESAGADPGPACYGSGGPLTVTDLNVFLGRVLPEHFPFHLDRDAVKRRLKELRTLAAGAGVLSVDADLYRLADGLLQIANDNMVQAIRRVSVSRGYDPRDYVLVCFGGAGGQHACAVARSLGIRKVLIHPFAGILSAWGIGQADVKAVRQRSFLKPLNAESLRDVATAFERLSRETRAEVQAQGVPQDCVLPAVLSLEIRYLGTDTSLTITQPGNNDWKAAFEAEHRRLFGYVRDDQPIEIASVRVESVGRTPRPAPAVDAQADLESREQKRLQTTRVFVHGTHKEAAVVSRDDLHPGDQVSGPAVIVEETSTVFVEPGCSATVAMSGTLVIDVAPESPAGSGRTVEGRGHDVADPVLLEVFNNQFAGIAAQMGEMLRRTATSTNVRERLDFSCALFDADGGLVVNAPHVPVHLGAMGETVRAIICDHPGMRPGDVYVTNDPFRGGSHLPDVTVVTPVFCSSVAAPDFFVASRAHHAEIGGIVPGSMPPFSRCLAEEGVLIRSRKLVDQGQSCESEIADLLTCAEFPTRALKDNLADLAAQVAANASGVRLLTELAHRCGANVVQAYMKHIQHAASKKMRLCLSELQRRECRYQDAMDDGTVIRVQLKISGDEVTVDFSGTAHVHEGNLNANRAITTAAVLYCFRCLLNEDVPLNAGVLEPVRMIVPEGLLNPLPGETPQTSPAVVGGNVETSQRIVDVLLGALELAAASQGTMNNLTFGNAEFGYYETICGGAGATAKGAGASGVHTHMTNTRLTDPEVLEHRYPVRLVEFSLRAGSGGDGQHRGGDGVVREIEFLESLSVSMLSQRRGRFAPYGLCGGRNGMQGKNLLKRSGDQAWTDVGGCFQVNVAGGDRLRIETPGGGGFGDPELSDTDA